METRQHTDRVRLELKAAGATAYGLGKSESRYLPHIIHEDEHIGGVIYGQSEGGSAMMVATNKRIIFLDKKPMFTTTDELTYDVVSGVRHDSSGFLHTVVLHTRIGDYKFRYVNKMCAKSFVDYIEKCRLEMGNNRMQAAQPWAYT